jgi:hypothetical protein
MQTPSMLQGDSPTRLIQGAIAGALLTLAIGFGWAGWQLQSKAQRTVEQSVNNALIAALAPICVDRFQRAANAQATLVALRATDSWKRDVFVEQGGWATFPGATEPNRNVAEACANLLNEMK